VSCGIGIPLIVFAMPGAWALDATATVDYSAEYTTNTARTETDEVEEWIHIPAFNVGLSQTGAQLELDAGYRLERRFHQEDLFDDESAATGDASVVWHALPERLDLIVTNTRTESTRRSLEASTEDNRQTVSYTSAGPVLRLRPRSNSELQLEYLYTDVSVEETDTDSERHGGTVRYIIDTSSTQSLTFAGGYQDVDYDNPIAPDLEVSTATMTLSRNTSALTLDLTGGYNRTERGLGRDTVDGPIFEAGVAWTVAPETVISLDASHQITDSSTNLTTGQVDFADEEVSEDTDLNEVFTETRGSISLARPVGNTDVEVTLTASEDDYEDALRDNERYSAGVSISRALTRRTDLSLSFDVGRRKYPDEGAEQDEYRGAFRISRSLTRRLSFSIGVRYDERDAEDAGRSYEEWTGLISLGYDLIRQP
jgi:hypothetical protein